MSAATLQIEPFYTVNQLAKLLAMSFERVRQLVRNEPGVVVVPPQRPESKRGKRTRVMYRIPQSVVSRILRRYTNPA